MLPSPRNVPEMLTMMIGTDRKQCRLVDKPWLYDCSDFVEALGRVYLGYNMLCVYVCTAGSLSVAVRALQEMEALTNEVAVDGTGSLNGTGILLVLTAPQSELGAVIGGASKERR